MVDPYTSINKRPYLKGIKDATEMTGDGGGGCVTSTDKSR